MKKIHYTDSYLLKPYHPVTIHVAGAGGTGSQVITNLARMNVALQALGHPGLHVTVFDPDIITEANIDASFSVRRSWGKARRQRPSHASTVFSEQHGRRKTAAIPYGKHRKTGMTGQGRQISSSPARTIPAHDWNCGDS